MTAFDLIDSIFARPQSGVAPEVRRITSDQLKYLRDLIGRDPEHAALQRAGPNTDIWWPAGRMHYVIEEVPGAKLHRLTRLGRIEAGTTPTLFE